LVQTEYRRWGPWLGPIHQKYHSALNASSSP
jgi:hypothetical protein